MAAMRGFFVGRFQPFHRGHAEFVNRIATDVDEVIVGIGSADLSHSVKNPFTAGERVSMIHQALTTHDTTTYVIPITDVKRDSIWAAHVASLCPPFDVAYTNNPLVRQLFEEAGYETKGMELIDRDQFQGTEIRRRIIAEEDWRHLVPDPVVRAIEEINGINRLRMLAEEVDSE